MRDHRGETIHRWWPTTQSLDLVEGSLQHVAAAVLDETRRFCDGDIESRWVNVGNLESALGEARDFTNVPTCFLVIPTKSRWTALWNNSSLCDGYDALCSCLTANHSLRTIHWAAHDDDTTFQAGSGFTSRIPSTSGICERSVYVGRQDAGWTFFQSGDALPEEDVAQYRSRKKRDRLNEASMIAMLRRLGADVWSDAFYDLPGNCLVIHRRNVPASILRKSRERVLDAGG